MSRSFVKHYDVRFGEIDHAGVMYYPALFDRMHRGFEDFWTEAAHCSYAHVLDHHNLGFPLVNIECSFSKPFRFGERLRVEIDVARIGGRSVSFRFRLGQGDEAENRAEATMVLGVIDLEKFEPCELPQNFRDYLAPYLVSDDAQG
jgi:4-hydroxybenzoyl-CoA thioesterase